MLRGRIKGIVRQFAQNGMKLLLEDPRNVRELLSILQVKVLDKIDFDKMVRVPTTFVQRDYRHVEADVVLRAPLRWPGARRTKQTITIYILIEHQSEPDPMMAFRVLEYVVQMYRSQARQWHQRHNTFAGLRFQPVLPIVFYTGTRRWDGVGRLLDLVDLGEVFKAVIPNLEPLFLNLSSMPPEVLENPSGFFSWVLRLVQQRRGRPAVFQALLRRVVEQLETMPRSDRLRWLELLSYVHALVYNDREEAEHLSLREEIEASVQMADHRKEVSIMGRTIAEALRAEGGQVEAIRSRRQILLRQLLKRFPQMPAETVAAVESCKNIQKLDAWLERVVTVTNLEEMGIG